MQFVFSKLRRDYEIDENNEINEISYACDHTRAGVGKKIACDGGND